MTLSTSTARDRLSEIIQRVQDPRYFCVLTRHGRSVAAVVSMESLQRIFRQEDAARVYEGTWAPGNFYSDGEGRSLTTAQAGEAVQKVQLDRLAERRILARSGLRPVPGGEVEMEVSPEALAEPEAPVAAPGRKRWWRWRRRG